MDTVESYYCTETSLLNFDRVDPKKEVHIIIVLYMQIYFNTITGFANNQRANRKCN